MSCENVSARTACLGMLVLVIVSAVVVSLSVVSVWGQHTARQDIKELRAIIERLRAARQNTTSGEYDAERGSRRSLDILMNDSVSTDTSKDNDKTLIAARLQPDKAGSTFEHDYQKSNGLSIGRRKRNSATKTTKRPADAFRNISPTKRGNANSNDETRDNKKSKKNAKLKAMHLNLDCKKYENMTQDIEFPIVKWWKPQDWSNHSARFSFNNGTGKLKVLEAGLYLIYSQVTYWNVKASNSYYVLTGQNETLTQCHLERRLPTTTAQSSSIPDNMLDSCFTSTIAMLLKNQEIWIGNPHQEYFQPMLNDEKASFWGVVLLSA